jgi:predicted secreted hydrolase
VRIDDWSLRLAGDTYTAHVAARDFAFTLNFAARQPVLLQGGEGVSRKGPREAQASFYYSRPQLAVDGTLDSGRSYASRCAGSRGSITSGPASISPRKRTAGTGSASISTTAAR